MVCIFIVSWFLIGLLSGLVCSGIDTKYKGFRFNWFDPFKMSFLGLVIFIWAPFLLVRSKRDKKIRNNQKHVFST